MPIADNVWEKNLLRGNGECFSLKVVGDDSACLLQVVPIEDSVRVISIL